MDTFWQDVRFGLRMLLKNPALTLMVVVTLGLGIGANTAMFSMVNAIILKPLPVPHAEQITGAFFSHCRGEQDWSLGFHPRSNERFADRDERSQTARVVGDARPLEPRTAA